MRTRTQLLQQLAVTQNPVELLKLAQEALDLVQFLEGQVAMANTKLQRLAEKNQRQADTIQRLEQTLWKK
jgi:hypothetical protein